jgi:hypothetical protein
VPPMRKDERADVTTDGQVSLSNGTLQRKRTAYRDAFQRNLCQTWKRISSQTPVIRRGPGSQAVMQGRSPAGGR